MAEKVYFEIIIPACAGDATGISLCTADRADVTGEIVASLLRANLKRPDWIRIATRLEISENANANR